MRVLILNWRDLRSPRGGGAERVTHEISRRLVDAGHDVTWLSSHVDGLPADESLDGVQIVRRGTELTSRLHAPRLAKEGFDVLVDAINTVPYLVPLWARIPHVVFFHQLARDVWWYEAPRPLGALGWAIEPLYLQVYRRTPAIVVSRSTRDDLRRFGLRGTVDVIPLAVDVGAQAGTSPPKELGGRLVAIGRLTPSKRFEDAIEALAALRSSHPAATIDIIGDGPEHEHLAGVAGRLGVADAVRLHGRLAAGERDRLLAGADVVVGTSVREGWGLTVTEGAALGTPAAVYDVPGFRDSVVDRRTGIVTAPDPQSLADGVRWLLADVDRYERVRRAARARANEVSLDDTATAFESALAAAIRRRG